MKFVSMKRGMMALVITNAALLTLMNIVLAEETNHAEIMAQTQEQKDHVGVWQRLPLVGLPLMTEAPVIDGAIEEREWFGAAKLPGFVDYNKGMSVRDRTDIYVGYTATHFYLAFQFERPESLRLPTDNDWFEFMLDTAHKHDKYKNGAFSLSQVKWTGIGPHVDRTAWQPKLEYKARATEFGWEGEIAIPFKEFGMDAPPAPGTIWGANFIRNEHTPVDRLALWSFIGLDWPALKNMGHLVFTGAPVAVRALGAGWVTNDRQAGVKLEVRNFGNAPVTLDTEMMLRKAAKPVQMEYYPRIDSAMSENLPAAIGSPLMNEVNSAMESYAVEKESKETIVVAPNSTKLIQLVEPDEPGSYLAGYALRQGDKLLAGALVPVEITVPLAIKVHSYLYSANTLEYEVDLRRVSDKIGANSNLLISVQDPQGKTLAEATSPIKAGSTESGGVLIFKPVPDSVLKVNARIVDGERIVAQNSQPLRIPAKPPWQGNQIGKKKFVPEPFTPVKATARSAQFSTAVYNWPANSFLPDIKVKGNAIFGAPTVLSFKDKAGAALPLKITSFTLKSQDIEQATYEFAGDLDGKATLSGSVRVEFDGFAWYQLTITPKAPLDLSASALEFTLKKEFSRLCTIGAAENTGSVVYSGGVPAAGIHSAFSFAYWLGDMEGGLQWIAENERNWFNANPKDVTQISTDEKAGHMKINFIDKPVTLDKPIEWKFGLIATPSRVKPAHWGEFGFLQTGMITKPLDTPLPANLTPSQKWELGNWWSYYNEGGWARDKGNIYGYIHHGEWQEIFGYPGTYVPQTQKDLTYSTNFLHKDGIKTLVYAGWGVNTSAPEWNDYGMEMVRLPLYNSGYGTYRQEPTSMWADWYIWKVAQMIKDYDIDGLFIDSATSPVVSENYTPGMRWVDEQGKVRGSFPILATREWMKRLYKMFHGELKKDGVIYNHQSPPAIMAIETLVDVRCPSEFAQAHNGEFDKTFLEFFEAKNGGEQFGLFNELTNKDWVGQWATKRTPQVYALCLPLNISIKAISSLFSQGNGEYGTYAIDGNHGVNQMMPWIWRANKWVDRSTAEYLPWWKNAQYIKTTPADDQVIHALWLHKGQKALLCVSNLKNVARKIDVQLDLAQLGMKSITVEDAVTGEKIEAPAGKMTLDVDFERFRLLKLEAKP